MDPVLLLAAAWELATVLRVSGDPLTSSGPQRYQACIQCTYIHTSKTPIHINEK